MQMVVLLRHRPLTSTVLVQTRRPCRCRQRDRSLHWERHRYHHLHRHRHRQVGMKVPVSKRLKPCCSETIDIKTVRNMCHQGIPEKPASLRPLCWMLLLDYLPLERAKWDDALKRKRELYAEFIQELIVDTHTLAKSAGAGAVDPLGALASDPLGALGGESDKSESSGYSKQPSAWDTYFKDNDTIEQIDKDVKRLCPEFAFFQSGTGLPRPAGAQRLHHRVAQQGLATESIGRSSGGGLKITRRECTAYDGGSASSSPPPLAADKTEFHWEVIERILFLYAKLNPGIGYVQGMNEICGPLYYVLASNPDAALREHAEADTYWCFLLLMAEFRDNFIKTLDDSDTGIGSLMTRFSRALGRYDGEVKASLDEKGIKPMFYGFRWLTCLLSQEFPLPDVIRLWDSLFSKRDRQEYLICICCSLVCIVRSAIISSGFADTVKLLQHMPSIESTTILSTADAISVFTSGSDGGTNPNQQAAGNGSAGGAGSGAPVDDATLGQTKFGKMAQAGKAKFMTFWGTANTDGDGQAGSGGRTSNTSPT
eukprot:m.50299 g.50299  ORF g.50299 m.50299 type:complete len:539 (-) comp7228_c0_seq1:230-1846(-)